MFANSNHHSTAQRQESQAPASNVPSLGKGPFRQRGFEDTRPFAVAQRKLQALANSYLTVPSWSEQVVQAKIKSPFPAAPLGHLDIAQILHEVDLYNKIGGLRFTFPIKERKQALNQLKVIEQAIFHWFDVHKSKDLNSSPIASNMKILMNRVLEERQDLVKRSLENKDADPPIANFDILPHEIQHEVTIIWKHLLKDEGISIEGDKAFRIKILTDFSRLLETKMGRMLTGGIIRTGHGLVIHPTSLAAGKFAAKPKDAESEQLLPSEDHHSFAKLDLREHTDSNRLKLLQHVRTIAPHSPGMTITSEKGTRSFRFGVGTGSTIPVPSDSTDAITHASSRMADRAGNEVISPTFINLGHELGHVLRSATGISAAGEGGRALLKHSFQTPDDSRPEEFFNIGGVENTLRKESGISARHGHGNLYSYWAAHGMDTLFTVENEIDLGIRTFGVHSEAGQKLAAYRVELGQFIEPFQELMRGNGHIAPLLKAFNSLVKIIRQYLRQEDQKLRTQAIMAHGGNIASSAEGNLAIGNFDL